MTCWAGRHALPGVSPGQSAREGADLVSGPCHYDIEARHFFMVLKVPFWPSYWGVVFFSCVHVHLFLIAFTRCVFMDWGLCFPLCSRFGTMRAD